MRTYEDFDVSYLTLYLMLPQLTMGLPWKFFIAIMGMWTHSFFLKFLLMMWGIRIGAQEHRDSHPKLRGWKLSTLEVGHEDLKTLERSKAWQNIILGLFFFLKTGSP